MPLLRPGAAVSPFKYTEVSLVMPYIKARKKIREGATNLICQCGWDANCSVHLMREFDPDSPDPAVLCAGLEEWFRLTNCDC